MKTHTPRRYSSTGLQLDVKRGNGDILRGTPDGTDPTLALAWMWLELVIGSTAQYSDVEATFIKDTIATLPATLLPTVRRFFQTRLVSQYTSRYSPCLLLVHRLMLECRSIR